MNYWELFTDQKGYVYSCDMVRLRFEFKESDFDFLVGYFLKSYRIDITTYPLSTKDFNYRYLFSIAYDKSSMSIGIGFNGAKREDLFIGFAEFNPNKCFQTEQCWVDIQFLFDHAWSYDLVRWDLAIDIPIGRKYLSLLKDGRKYENVWYSADNRTEYLGVRNEPGRIKLYNKAAEDKYKEFAELTRLELTCSGDWSSGEILSKLPYVDCIREQNDLLVSSDLSNTQRILVELINSSDAKTYYFRMLNHGMQQKLRKYIFNDERKIVYDRFCIDQVLRLLKRTLSNFKDGYYRPDPFEKTNIKAEAEVNPFCIPTDTTTK